MSAKQKVVIILGPTGIGKTHLVLEAASRVGGEIVAADSVQVYRYLNIGSAKPTDEEQARVPHHLIDVIDPDEEFSAGEYREEAQRAIQSIAERKRPVLVSGGTGFYIKALTRGLFAQPPGNEDLREEMRLSEEKEGKGYLHRRLAEVDPVSAQRIHPHDQYRIVRALEVFRLTGIPLSQHHGNHNFNESPYEVLGIGLYLDRDDLYRRINDRCDRMMEEGFLNEVQDLIAGGYHAGLRSMRSLGYRHLCAHLEGGMTREEAVSAMKRDTRRYAKRQMTWFRRDPGIVWIENSPAALDKVEKLVQNFLGSAGAVQADGRF